LRKVNGKVKKKLSTPLCPQSVTAEGLTKGVNQMLASGWRLQGGVSTSVGFDFQDDDHKFYFSSNG
jgi:hypothetical protein